MYLKRLQMQGFKSFPDKIDIDFGAGITAIVGPNGSGKSNIVDAIRWVLGEQSSKTLRGAKMEDVIFGGTIQRKQVGYAEVSLTLDNSERDLATDYTEVTVTRRYYRSGESEYYLNKAACRLKDIHELFMNTGLGRDGYSMIGQGKIAEVLSVRSEDRRAIFEEAAGISKYRYRKLESERKLAATEENLVRLRDILGELSERVGPLKSQSEKARRYLDLREERKGLEIDLWLATTETTKDLLSKLASDSLTIASQLQSVEEESGAAEKKLDSVFEETRAKNAEIDDLQRNIREENERSSAHASACAVLQNDMDHAEARAAEIAESLTKSDSEKEIFAAQIAEKEQAILAFRQEIETKEAEVLNLTAACLAAEQRDAGFAGRGEQLTAEIALLAGKETDCRIERSSLAALLEKTLEQEKNLQQEDCEREKQQHEAEREITRIEGELQAAKTLISTNANIISGYEKKRETKEIRLAEKQKELQKTSDALREKLSRANLLTDMENHLEGFGYAIKKVMSEKQRGALRGIHGPLSGLIETDDQYVIAIETAMGGALQHIVTENENDAKMAIRLLKEQKAGRATFLPLTAVRGSRLSENQVLSEEGVIGIAADLVRCEEKYRAAVLSACGRCLVCEDIDGAVRIAKKYGYRFKIVTLDGQVVNPGGSLTGGSLQKNAGILSRKNEIARLKSESEKLRTQFDEMNAEVQKLERENETIKAALLGARAESATANDQVLVLAGERSRYQMMADTLRAAFENRKKVQMEIEAQKKEIEARDAALVLESEALREQTKEKELALQKEAENREETAKELLDAKETLSSLKYAVSLQKREIEIARASIAEIESRLELFSKEQNERRAQIEKLAAEKERLSTLLLEKQKEIDESAAKCEAMKTRIAEAAKEREEIERGTTALRAEIKEKTAEKEKLIKEQMRLEGKKAAIEGQYDQIVAKLWDEYELTISAAKEQKRPLGDKREAERRIAELRGQMKTLGNVNIDSIEEYQLVKERYEFYTTQVGDLEHSREELSKIIAELTQMMREIFGTQFAVINEKFSMVFKELFGGGSAYLELTDPSDILTSGIEIKVSPPGKIIKSLQLLSGGEQTFVAIALYFAILAVKPVPFCIMDEIEAALDDVNVTRFANYLRRYCANTQFIVVTHRRGTMEEADVLYGVTMQEKGISKLLTIHVSEIEKQLKLKVN